MLRDPKDNELEKRVKDLEKAVSDLARAEKTAQAELIKLEQIFQTVTEGVIVIDTNFNVLRVNEAFLKLAGVADRNAIGRKCFEVFPGKLCHTPACPLVRIRSGVERLEYEGEKHRNDGKIIPCLVTVKPFRGPNGELLGIVEDLKDISVLKHAREELQHSFDRTRKTMGGIIQAMSSFRPYRMPPGIDAALAEISQKKGILYDSLVVDACLACFRKEGFEFGEKKTESFKKSFGLPPLS